MVSCY